jgi:uncharacterized protein YlxW (UPF0749 family)
VSERARERTFAPDFLTELFRNPLDPGYLDAARLRGRAGPVTGRRRRVLRSVTVVTLFSVGLLFAVAYRQTLAEEPGRARARAGLVAQIREREAQADQMTARAERLRAEVTRQRDAAVGGRTAARLRDLEAVTGLARVRGDGVVVRVADAPVNPDAVTGASAANLGRVLDSDLQEIANALWSGGAEAIAINGQRLTATSTIRAAGGAILVDYRPVTGPYEVSAIGPEQLERRFRDTTAARLLRKVAAEHGLSFGVRSAEDLVLPAGGEPQLRSARPLPTPGASPDVSPSPVPTLTGGGR